MTEDLKNTSPKEEAKNQVAKETSKATVQETSKEAPSKVTSSAKTPLTAQALIDQFEKSQQKNKVPDVYVGDTVRVGVRISEGNKERVQPYEGVVIAKRHGGLNESITVRRIFQGSWILEFQLYHMNQSLLIFQWSNS